MATLKFKTEIDDLEIWDGMPSTQTLLWAAGFETGNLSEVPNPEMQPPGTAKLSVVTSPVYSGTYACKAEILSPPTDGSDAKCRAGFESLNDGYYEAAFYIPSTFDVPVPGGWCQLLQLQEPGPGWNGNWNGFCGLFLSRGSGGPLKFVFIKGKVGNHLDEEWWLGTVPLNRYFTVVVHLKTGTSGILQLWIDGVLVVDATPDLSSPYVGPAYDVGIYQGGCPAQHVFVDEIRVTSTPPLKIPLTIQSNLPVPVTVDGAGVGTTPVTVQVTPGSHTVSVPQEVNL